MIRTPPRLHNASLRETILYKLNVYRNCLDFQILLIVMYVNNSRPKRFQAIPTMACSQDVTERIPRCFFCKLYLCGRSSINLTRGLLWIWTFHKRTTGIWRLLCARWGVSVHTSFGHASNPCFITSTVHNLQCLSVCEVHGRWPNLRDHHPLFLP